MRIDSPAFVAPGSRVQFALLTGLRTTVLMGAILALGEVVDLGTSSILLALSIAIASVGSSLLSFSRLTSRGFLLLCALGSGALIGGVKLLHQVPISSSTFVFSTYVLELHLTLLLIVALLGGISSWFFWRTRLFAPFEFLVANSAVLALFSGHHRLRLDRPQFVNTLAWNLNLTEPYVFACVGAVLALGSGWYLYAASSPLRPVRSSERPVQAIGRSRVASVVVWALLCIAVPLVLSRHIIVKLSDASSLTASGVGQEKKEGLSPLGFHSALGGTNQPAALVRFNTEYKENPFSPMLYLREGALSEFNGTEMVLAPATFDTDITRTDPTQSFQGEEDPTMVGRVKEEYSIYLLADHKSAFALDYPLTITQLKNPNPNRFRGAYKALSLAPTYKFGREDLQHYTVGDPRWTPEIRSHYLKTHPDVRYRSLAESIVSGLTSPIEEAFSITEFLSKESTYTLTPNHEPDPNGDQVAPYLFGDLRGYCVHFAHATVYMLRSLGIPARIGTGYLTDLSQAKDGHILLRMSDRHAWAEIFVRELGWIPLDTKPDKVESHADTQVDMKLLEELMSMLEPDQEILPKESSADEEGLKGEDRWSLPSRSTVLLSLFCCIGVLLALKVYIRYGWKLSSDPGRKLTRWYLASLSHMYDTGVRRNRGETRQEFSLRASSIVGAPVLNATEAFNEVAYRAALGKSRPIDELILKESASLRVLPLWKRVLSFFNPSSIWYFCGGGRW